MNALGIVSTLGSVSALGIAAGIVLETSKGRRVFQKIVSWGRYDHPDLLLPSQGSEVLGAGKRVCMGIVDPGIVSKAIGGAACFPLREGLLEDPSGIVSSRGIVYPKVAFWGNACRGNGLVCMGIASLGIVGETGRGLPCPGRAGDKGIVEAIRVRRIVSLGIVYRRRGLFYKTRASHLF